MAAEQRPAHDIAWWAMQGDVTEFRMRPYTRRSLYIPTRDGVRLAADVYSLAERPRDQKVPTVLHSTRYHRRRVPRDPYASGLFANGMSELEIRRYLAAGYALVSYDARGSGASFGTRKADPDLQEILDVADVCDWIVDQPWSDGTIGATGVSYEGTTAENAMRCNHPAIRGAAVRFAFFDALVDGMIPGGLAQSWLFDDWFEFVSYLDRNAVEEYFATVAPEFMRPLAEFTRGVAPVDDDPDGVLLAEAVAEHANNVGLLGVTTNLVWRDGPQLRLHAEKHGLDEDQTAAFHVDEIARSGPVYSYCGWYDSAYGLAAIKRFKALEDHGARLMMGPWDHGGPANVDPTNPAKVAQFDHIGEVIRFLDETVRGVARADVPRVRYFTMGEGWKFSDTWPPPGLVDTKFYFGDGGSLSTTHPDGELAADSYVVDQSHTTGLAARWRSVMNFHGLHIEWPDRAEQDKKLLVYETTPLETSVEVTGHPVAVLHVTSSADDGAFFVYLEEVTAGGEVRYVTEGLLRARHRQISPNPPVWESLTPFHSLLEAVDLPLVPGEAAQLAFGLHPISYRFAAGSRIRVAIGGADADNFIMVPEQAPEISILRDREHASHVILPLAT